MRQELDERPIESHRRFCPAQLRTKHHAVLLSGACLIAAAGTGCSVLFGGSRYVGGTDLDAAEPDLDASSDAASDEDVSGPIDPDAHVEDAYAGPDAVTPCVDTASCGADEVCDPERSVCLPCDGDGDGIRARGCAMDDRRFFDCDPDHASRVTSMVLTDGFQDTLRVFHEGGETHVFFRDPRSVNTFQVGVDGVQRELDYGGVRVDEIDAVRTPDGVVIAGVHREGFVQYVLEPSGPEERGALLYADTAEFGTILVASSVPAILSASVTPTSVDALVEVQSMMRDGTPIGRHVIGIGSGHQARVWGSSGLPDDRVAASANGIAVVPSFLSARR